MKLSEFKKLINANLPCDLDDLPDINLYNYWEEDFTEEESIAAAEEVVSDFMYDNGLL